MNDEFFFRTTRFQFDPARERNATEAPIYGKDLAEWLASRLTESGWQTGVVLEDWGWCVTGISGSDRYIFGVYDYSGTDNPHIETGEWCIRLFNQTDSRPLLQKWFSREAPAVEESVSGLIFRLLEAEADFVDLQTACPY